MSVVAGYMVPGGCWLASDSLITVGDHCYYQDQGKWLRASAGTLVGVVGDNKDEARINRAILHSAMGEDPWGTLAELAEDTEYLICHQGVLTLNSGIRYRHAPCFATIGSGAGFVLGWLASQPLAQNKAEARKLLKQALTHCFTFVPSCGGKIHFTWSSTSQTSE